MAMSEEDIGKIVDIVSGQIKEDLPARVLRQVILQVVDRLEGRTTPAPAPTALPTDSYQTTGLYARIEKTNSNRVIISAFGKDRPGIVAAISKVLSDSNIAIQDIRQNIMQEFFGMIMIADISKAAISFDDIKTQLGEIESSLGCKILIQHEDIFRYMHRI